MENLRIAIQKSGRLSEKSLKLISESGIKLTIGSGKLVATADNFPIEVLFLRDDDIPEYVKDGVADIGIVGENGYLESDLDLTLVQRLGFSKCRLSLAIAKDDEYKGPSYFEGKRIATSYPVILKKYLKEQKVDASVHEISGSVEIAPGIGLADGIFDIVSTGSTLKSNNLKEVEVVMRSEAIMLATPGLVKEKQEILDDLLFRFGSVRKAQNFKYILLNAPNDKLNDIIGLIPGMKSPTVMPLAEEGWSSVHSVLEEKTFWENIDKLKEFGAQGILVIPIEKMIV